MTALADVAEIAEGSLGFVVVDPERLLALTIATRPRRTLSVFLDNVSDLVVVEVEVAGLPMSTRPSEYSFDNDRDARLVGAARADLTTAVLRYWARMTEASPTPRTSLPCLASSARRRLPLSDGLRCSVPTTALVQCPTLISLLRYQWTSDGWEDPLEAAALDPWRGYAGEDCSDAFDDEGFSE